MSGSLIVFAAQFAVSLVLGRLFCGWACPVGGLQELVSLFRGKRANPRRLGWIKYLVWAPWLAGLVFLLLRAGGVHGADFFYQTRHGISVTEMSGLIAYLSVCLLFFVLALTIGKRAGCHTVCWMAPFMVMGRAVRNTLSWPSLRLSAEKDRCTSCGTCARQCPMSLEVTDMVKTGRMEDADCILCGTCVDSCPHSSIRFAFGSGRDA
jgi:polyferredoxin